MPSPVAVSRLPVGSSASSTAGLPGHGAGDGDPLPLAPGQLGRPVGEPVPEPHPLQRPDGRRRRRQPGAAAPVEQPERYIVYRVDGVEQVELLEHEAEPVPADRRQPASGQGSHVPRAGDPDRTAGGPFQGAEDVQQGGFARS